MQPLLVLLIASLRIQILNVAGMMMTSSSRTSNSTSALVNRPVFLKGRNNVDFPVDKCCDGNECIGQRIAILCSVRDTQYVNYAINLFCSIRRLHPDIPFIATMTKDELPLRQIQRLQDVGMQIEFFEDFYYENKKIDRFGRNFIKVRCWAMTQYDTLLVLDADTVVIQDILHMFSLPAEFAMAIAHSEESVDGHVEIRVKKGNGGVLLIHPCQAIHDHMVQLLNDYPILRFTEGMAEQEFFNWYTKTHTASVLSQVT
jgi:hypothetical protein